MTRTSFRTSLLALAALACASTAFAAEATRQIDRTFSPAAGRSVSLENLAGNVTVSRAAGNEIRVSATIHAEAGSIAAAEELAGLLQIAVDDSASAITVRANYPLDRHRKYSYPRRGDRHDLPWFLEWLDLGTMSSKYQGVQVRIVSDASSSAPTLFADFRIEVPAGVGVSVDNRLGELRAAGVEGDLHLELGSGMIEARDGKGVLGLETGSGDVDVIGQSGRVRAESGSGDIRLERIQGESVTVETGSGDVKLVDVDAALSAETGSGDVVGDRLVAHGTLTAETGSGDIRLAGDLSALTRLDISTGSGDVTLIAERTPQIRLQVSTGSGDITVDLPVTRITRSDRNDLRAEIGAATGTGSISTGSGDVRVRSAP